LNSFKIQSTMEEYQKAIEFIEDHLVATNMNQQNRLKVLIACEELIVNIINYAYEKGNGDLEIEFEEKEDWVKITICDNGKAFNPLQKADAEVETSIEEREVGGLGILMLKKLIDQIEYSYQDGQNRITMMKQKATV